MSKIAIEEWYKEATGDIAANQSSMGMPDSSPMGAPNVQQNLGPSQQNAKQGVEQNPDQGSQQPQMPDVSQDPVAPDMPEETQDQNFEDWKNNYFRESIKGDVSKLIEMIQQVRDTELDSYPRKFVEDNLEPRDLKDLDYEYYKEKYT